METLLTPLSLLGSSIIVVWGWIFVHRKTTERDLLNKKRELRVEYLIDAYRRLELISNRPITESWAPDFEKAVADIQLFGTPSQVDLTQEFARNFTRDRSSSLDALISELRSDLRKELSLEPVSPNIVYLRIRFDDSTKE